MKKFAVFDIDGTLIRWQLYHVMVDKLAGEGALGPHAKQRLRDARMIWKRREHVESFKEYESVLIQVYEEAIGTLTTDVFDRWVTEVTEEYKDQTYAYTRELVKQLKQDGFTLLAISGSHYELVEQIGSYYGFDDCVGSRYERQGKGFSGAKFVGSHDKRTVLEGLVQKHKLSYTGSLAIGDSASDIAMLELVEKPIAFNPDKLLFKKAREQGWPIVIERKNMIYELELRDGRYLLAQAD